MSCCYLAEFCQTLVSLGQIYQSTFQDFLDDFSEVYVVQVKSGKSKCLHWKNEVQKSLALSYPYWAFNLD